ncbi:unnamed protein product [Amoebophrya sp. A120]|nr:unnamed protein product [Amoebophrya sp. A120]|eukprot:GSA120T00009941001.1
MAASYRVRFCAVRTGRGGPQNFSGSSSSRSSSFHKRCRRVISSNLEGRTSLWSPVTGNSGYRLPFPATSRGFPAAGEAFLPPSTKAQTRRQSVLRKAPRAAPSTSSCSLYSDWCTSFEQMELHPELLHSLNYRKKIFHPTKIQADSWRPQSLGKDTVIQSETGSGKTLAYLLPILNRVFYRAAGISHSGDEQSIGGSRGLQEGAHRTSFSSPARTSSTYNQHRRPCVILTANADLCVQLIHDIEQIDPHNVVVLQSLGTTWCRSFLATAASDEDITTTGGRGGSSSGGISSTDCQTSTRGDTSGSAPTSRTVITSPRIRFHAVDVVVSTVQKFAEDLPQLCKDGFYPETVVFDEADLLFHGATRTYVYDIFSYLRPRLKIRQPGEENFVKMTRLPLIPTQFVFSTATVTHIGPLSIGNMLIERFCTAETVHGRGGSGAADGRAPTVEQGLLEADENGNYLPASGTVAESSLLGVFPAGGGGPATTSHTLPESIQTEWIYHASEDWNTRVEDLIRLLQEKQRGGCSGGVVRSGRFSQPVQRTLIFTNKASNAEILTDHLRRLKWPVVLYAKGKKGKMGPRMREVAENFLGGSCTSAAAHLGATPSSTSAPSNGSMDDGHHQVQLQVHQPTFCVSTDLGGRGIDWPDIDHVVNFEFPRDAITFLHRAGRTGRMGRPGLVTSFIAEKDQQLAESIVENFDSLEKSFSLKRSLRKRRRRQAAAEDAEEQQNKGLHSGTTAPGTSSAAAARTSSADSDGRYFYVNHTDSADHRDGREEQPPSKSAVAGGSAATTPLAATGVIRWSRRGSTRTGRDAEEVEETLPGTGGMHPSYSRTSAAAEEGKGAPAAASRTSSTSASPTGRPRTSGGGPAGPEVRPPPPFGEVIGWTEDCFSDEEDQFQSTPGNISAFSEEESHLQQQGQVPRQDGQDEMLDDDQHLHGGLVEHHHNHHIVGRKSYPYDNSTTATAQEGQEKTSFASAGLTSGSSPPSRPGGAEEVLEQPAVSFLSQQCGGHKNAFHGEHAQETTAGVVHGRHKPGRTRSGMPAYSTVDEVHPSSEYPTPKTASPTESAFDRLQKKLLGGGGKNDAARMKTSGAAPAKSMGSYNSSRSAVRAADGEMKLPPSNVFSPAEEVVDEAPGGKHRRNQLHPGEVQHHLRGQVLTPRTSLWNRSADGFEAPRKPYGAVPRRCYIPCITNYLCVSSSMLFATKKWVKIICINLSMIYGDTKVLK